MQVASVCRRLAEAAEALLSLPGVVADLRSDKQRAPCLVSSLLLSWAPHFSRMILNDSILSHPCQAFLARAERLHTVEAHSCSLTEAAVFDQVLGRHPTITKLTCQGWYLPHAFPPNLRELHVDCATLQSQKPTAANAKPLAEQLVVRLSTSAPQLRSLSLGLALKPILACQSCLPQLEELCVSFRACYVPADLKWLRTLPHVRLIIICQCEWIEQYQQEQAFQEIQGRAQQQWAGQLTRCSTVIMRTTVGSCWHRKPHQLRMLPACPRLHISVTESSSSVVTIDVVVHWGALAGQPRRVSIMLHTPRGLELQGFPGQLPFEDKGKPWQLTVHGQGSLLTGFPASCACVSATHMLQNRAAAAAGWTDELDDFCA